MGGDELSVSPQGCTPGAPQNRWDALGMFVPKVFVYWDRGGGGTLPDFHVEPLGSPD
jgi:hypothetical protein